MNRLAMLGAVGAALAAVAVPAAAAEPAAISVGTDWALVAGGVYAEGSLTVTCSPAEGLSQSQSAFVTLSQVVKSKGQELIQIGGASVQGPLLCDGLPHDYTVRIFPSAPQGQFPHPWRRGPAIATATAQFCSFVLPPPGCTTATAGPTEVELHK